MAGLPSNNVVDSWAPEPELREAPPRRFEPRSEEYLDLNKPSKILFVAVGAAILLGGLILLVLGMHKQQALIAVIGTAMAIGGAVLVGLYPVRLRSHMARAEHLVSYGVPVIARILAADNLTGDSTYARSVKYQVVMPGGEMAHRTVNADERLLPSRVPADTTALMDISTSDVELYCALPLRAAEAPSPVSRIPVGGTPAYSAPIAAPVSAAAQAGFGSLPVAEAPPVAAGGMGTMASLSGGRSAAPQAAPPQAPPQAPAPTAAAPVPTPAPLAEPAAPSAPETEPTPPPAPAQKPKDKSAGSSGLPWE